MERHVVARGDAYCAFPDIAALPDGSLLAAWREGDGHTGRAYSRLVVARGDTSATRWDPPVTLAELAPDPAQPDWLAWNCPRIAVLPDDAGAPSVVLACDRVRRTSAPAGHRETPDAVEFTAEAETYLWRADAALSAWTGPEGTGVRGIVPDRPVMAGNGDWLLATHHAHPATGVLAQWVCRSADRGRTWSAPVPLAHDGVHQLCEASLVRLHDGTLVAYLRENSFRGLPGFKALSHDDGRSWHGPYPTTLAGCHRPAAGLLPSGQVLVTYGLCHGGFRDGHYCNRDPHAALESQASAAQPVQALQHAHLLALDHDAHAHPDGGYTGWAALPDGRIACLYYIKDDWPRGQLRICLFRESNIVRS